MVLGVDFEKFVFVSLPENLDAVGLFIEVCVEMVFELGEACEILLVVPVGEVFALVGRKRILQQMLTIPVSALKRLSIIRQRC